MNIKIFIPFYSLYRLFMILSFLQLGMLTNAQAQKKIGILNNDKTQPNKFQFSGDWGIVDMQMNIRVKNNQPSSLPNILQKNGYVGKRFSIEQSKQVISYKDANKTLLKSTIEMVNIKDNVFIMRGMTGGFNVKINSISSKEAKMVMSRAVFFLFVTNLNIKREQYKTIEEYELANGKFYKDLLQNFTIINDEPIQFHLKKIN